MSEISSLYSSKQTVYKKTNKPSSKGKNGDLKHIVYKDGKPLLTEIIKVHKSDQEIEERHQQSQPKRMSSSNLEPRERKSSSEVQDKKRKKLSERLKNAIRNSQTLWSEKDRIWISYQGSQGFLVKLFDASNRVVSNETMTQTQILENTTIPRLFETSWKIV